MIYIKTQVFMLLRYSSPAPRNIARSDWVTQNITHNSYALHKPHEQKELQGITHHYILYSNHSFIYFI